MIIVKLMGGLGNQMFQYAAARGLSDETIYLDLSFLDRYSQSTESFTARKYELDLFGNLKAKKLNGFIARILCHTGRFAFLKIFLPKRWNNFTVIGDNTIEVIDSKKNYILDGYFQNEQLFKEKSISIKQEFIFPTETDNLASLSNQVKNKHNSVAIHVRRGDYLKPNIGKHHPVLDIEYYKKAIEYINSKIKNPFFYIFSDDPIWCESNFTFLNFGYKIIEKRYTDWESMYLMSVCKHNIIANSSFSWWGAWLNKHEIKIVIAPKFWFPKLQNPASEDWIKI